MSRSLTTDKLVKSTKRRSMMPTDQVTFTKQDFLDILNEEMDIGIIPFLLSTHEEYLVYTIDIPFSDGEIIDTNKLAFQIPTRAIGNKLRGAQFIGVGSTNLVYELTRVDIDDIHIFNNDLASFTSSQAYYVQNDKLVILNNQEFASHIRMYFYMRPSILVEEKYGAIVQSIDSTTGIVTVDKIPTNFSTAQQYDFTGAKIPNKILNYDSDVLSINSTSKTITFSASDISKLSVGDYITVANETIVPQIPVELHPLIAQRAAVHCLHAIGDVQNVQAAEVKMNKMETKVIDLIDNRVEDSPQKINNLHSPMRQLSRRYYKRRF
jgi:hypothetical protein